MKKFLIFVLVVCLVFSSSSIVFASATQWDTSDQTNLSNAASRLATIVTALTSTGTGTLLRSVNNIYTALTSSTQQGSLYNGVAYLYDIRQALTNTAGLLDQIVASNTYLSNIWSVLSYTIDGAGISYFVAQISNAISDLSTIESNTTSIKTTANNTYSLLSTALSGLLSNTASIKTSSSNIDSITALKLPILDDLKLGLTSQYGQTWSSTLRRFNAHVSFVNSSGEWTSFYYQNGNNTSTTQSWQNGSPLGNIAYICGLTMRSVANIGTDLLKNFNSSQTYTNWNGSTLTTANFTPTSATNGIYTWLSKIQTPIARLAFVHASDEEIEARQLAEDNQQAVVDDFIDPNGDGSVPTSSFGSLSGLSFGIKTNISTDAAPSGIFDVFNSEHGSWFSQDTANALDSSSSLRKGDNNFATPLLDQQIDNIYNALGVKK